MSMRKGLPPRAKMRHDLHFVEELTQRSINHIGMIVPLSAVEPNPDQPRNNVGNIDELTASVIEKGILEPILVRVRDDNRYQIISGERRYRAAVAAGLEEIPVIEIDADDKEVLEIALIENIQRKDLTPFEEAEGFQQLQEKFGYTHERISQVIGKSRTTITETLTLNGIPDRIRALCRERNISNKSVLVQIARVGDETAMERLVERFASGEMSRDEVRKETRTSEPAKRAGRPKNFVFQLKDKALPFSFNLTFKKSEVEREEIIGALRAILNRLEKEK